MNNPYDIHSWSTQYRQERMQEARKRHIVKQARTGRVPRESRQIGLAWGNLLALLRGA